MIIKWPTEKIPPTLKEIEEVLIPTDGVKRKLDGVVDSVLPDKDCEVLDEELNQQ